MCCPSIIIALHTFMCSLYILSLGVSLEFFLLGVHIRPSDVCSELDALEEAYFDASYHFDNTSGVMLGDFNADCR